ncbi:YpsA SLOG family protein [Nitratireductor sp. CH_MIT9313-5]|uniref:YpsA SLOG family protein n=1 Tax=Nitratireductor sp. CH_MIT9313-5 TaxID=3107764 RepID=UPI003FA56F8A
MAVIRFSFGFDHCAPEFSCVKSRYNQRSQAPLDLGSLFMKIITGGQTGVDLGALQFARAQNFPYGGWVPKGRLNEAGTIDTEYETW